MKKIIACLIVIGVVGVLGFTSYKIVDNLKNAEVSLKIESAKSAEYEQSENSREEGENSKELDGISPQNQGSGSVLGDKSSNEDLLDFSSVDAFVQSYKGYSVDMKEEEVYYSKLKSMMCLSTCDGLEILWADNWGIYEVKIIGNVKEEIGGKVDESKYTIKEVDGTTIISLNSNN